MSRRRNVTRTAQARLCGLCPRETRDEAYVCGHCADALLDDLIQLSDWLIALLDSVCAGERGVSYSGSMGSGDGEFVNWRALDAQREIRAALDSLAGLVLSPVATYDMSTRGLANLLTQDTERIVLRPSAPSAIGRLRDATRTAMRLVDLPPERQFIGPCPECEVGRVYADPISDFGKCDTCRARIEAAPLWDAMLTRLEDQHVTAAEAARLALVMGLTEDRLKVRKRIGQWAVRGLIQTHESVTGETVFRFGDVWARLSAHN